MKFPKELPIREIPPHLLLRNAKRRLISSTLRLDHLHTTIPDYASDPHFQHADTLLQVAKRDAESYISNNLRRPDITYWLNKSLEGRIQRRTHTA